MIILDSDHVSVLQIPDNDRRTRLLKRIAEVEAERISTTIITVEEQMRGWLASVAKERAFERQAHPTDNFADSSDFSAVGKSSKSMKWPFSHSTNCDGRKSESARWT